MMTDIERGSIVSTAIERCRNRNIGGDRCCCCCGGSGVIRLLLMLKIGSFGTLEFNHSFTHGA